MLFFRIKLLFSQIPLDYRIIPGINREKNRSSRTSPLFFNRNVAIVLLRLLPATLATLITLAITSCAQIPSTYQLHYDIHNPARQKFSNNILLIPTEIVIKERFPGGVIEDIPNWTLTTNQIIIQELKTYLASTLGIGSSFLDPDNNPSLVHTHTALLKLVNRAVRKHTHGWNDWPHKRVKFDYTIGSGLSFLRNQQVDTALIVSGLQTVTVARYDDSIENISEYSSAQLNFGVVRFSANLINLDTGDILWSNIDKFTGVDMRTPTGVRSWLGHALKSFPVGIFSNN